MKSKKMLAILTCATLATSMLAGCGSKKTESTNNNTASTGTTDTKKEEPKDQIDKDQYLNLLITEPKTLDASKATDTYSSYILQEISEGLTRLECDEKGNDMVKLAGAEKMEVSPDGLTWTFTLRDYKWSDGQPVKASDFEYAIKRTLNPATASQYAYLLAPIKGAEAYNGSKSKDKAELEKLEKAVGVVAKDDKTLVITLGAPCAYFKELTYFKVMLPQRKDFVEKYGDKFGTEAETMPACGPFKIKEWVHNNQIVLEKNPTYYDAAKVKLQKVTFRDIKETETVYQELEKGGIDSAGVSKTEWVKVFSGKKDMTNIKGVVPTVGYYFFNQKNEILKSNKVRQAFSMSMKRDEIVSTLYYGVGTPAYSWVPPTMQIGGKDFRQTVSYEPIKKLMEENKSAKELFQAGLKDLGKDTDTSKYSFKVLVAGTSARAKEVAEYYQNMWQKELGIKLNIEYYEWAVFQTKTDNYEFDLASQAWGADYNDPMTMLDMFTSTAGMAPTGWVNAKYDDLIKQASGTMDQEKRTAAFKEAEKILLHDEAVIAPISISARNTFRYNYVKGIQTPLFAAGSELKYAYTQGRPTK